MTNQKRLPWLEPLNSVGQIAAVLTNGLRCRRSVADGTMRPDGVVVLAPMLDQHLGLLEGVEDLTVEQLIPKLPVEALVVAVLPGAPWLDIEGLHIDPSEPFPNSFGGELRAIVRADMIRCAVPDHEVGKDMQNILRSEAP